MTKALFFDIDGTLVPFQTHGVPASTRAALHEVRAKGVKVFICTGRPLQFIDNLEGVEYDGIICVTGALCLTAEGETIHSQCIPAADIQRLITHLRSNGPEATPFLAVTRDGLFAHNANHEAVRFVMDFLHVNMPRVAPIEAVNPQEVLQLIGFFTQEEEPMLMNDVLKGCEAMRWYSTFADVIAKGISKSYGMDRMLAHFHIDLSETMAFGDGGNDIPMLAHAAIGVAMGNASAEVQRHADYVTDTADRDGICKALRHFELIGSNR